MAKFTGGHWVESGNALGTPKPGKFVKSFTPGSSEHLSIEKLDELILAVNALVTQFNAFLAHVDTANVVGIGNTNLTTYGGTKISKTASDQLVQSPKQTNL